MANGTLIITIIFRIPHFVLPWLPFGGFVYSVRGDPSENKTKQKYISINSSKNTCSAFDRILYSICSLEKLFIRSGLWTCTAMMSESQSRSGFFFPRKIHNPQLNIAFVLIDLSVYFNHLNGVLSTLNS